MGTKLVANIKNFITSGRHMTNIKSLIKGSYPNGYRNFGPDLDRMMMPLNKKYIDTSKLVDQINDESSVNNNNSKDNYFLLILKCLIDYIQWDIKKERENYAKYGILLFIKLIENCNENWIEAIKLTGFIRNQLEIWLSKENSLLQYYGKWILLSNMKRNIEINIDRLINNYNINYNNRYQCLNSLPIKLCTLNPRIIELLCKNMININEMNIRKKCQDENIEENDNYLEKEKKQNRDLIDLKIILEIILLGLLTESILFEGKSKLLISEYIIPSLASVIDTRIVSIFGTSYHNVKYYSRNETPGISLNDTINRLREDNNLFFQGDTIKTQDLVEIFYINYLYIIETLSMIFTKEIYEEKNNREFNNMIKSDMNELPDNGSVTINNNSNINDLNSIQKFKVQNKMNILPIQFKSLNDKLYSLYYYPYIITSDICLSICRGNNEYTIELINLITNSLRYHTVIEYNNNNNENNLNNFIFLNNGPFFINDELIISISGIYDEIPKSILFYETPKYCYSLLRCLHRVLCCCPRVIVISKLISTLVNLIDAILPLYDLNGTLCSRFKNIEGSIINSRDMEKCALLLRNVAFQVLFDIMCILSETSQVFYVIRVLVKIRDWCGSCLLDLIRRCQRLASQCNIVSGNVNHFNNHKQKSRQKFEKSEYKNKTGLFSTSSNTVTAKIDDNILGDNVLFGNNNIYNIDLKIVNPSFWDNSKILEIANINKKWITGQIGNFNHINYNYNHNINNNANNNLTSSTDALASSKITQLILNKNDHCDNSNEFSKDNKINVTTNTKTTNSINIDDNNSIYDNYNSDDDNSDDYDRDCDTSEDENETDGIDYDENEDDDYWEVDHKLLELIKLRPTSSIINAQPPTSGILRRTVSSDVNKNTFSKIGSISSLWTKHNSTPTKTLSSIKRVCFAEIAQIY